MENKQFCKFCGAEIAADAIVCPKCGRSLATTAQKINEVRQAVDERKGWMAFLGFLVPLYGIIAYFIFKGEHFPLRAKSCIKGALIGICVHIVLILTMCGALSSLF